MAFLDENGLAELWGIIKTQHDGFVNEHIWRRTLLLSEEIPAYYELGEKQGEVLVQTKGPSGQFYCAATSYSVVVDDSTGAVSLKDPQAAGSLWNLSYIKPQIEGKYIMLNGEVLYVPAGVTYRMVNGAYVYEGAAYDQLYITGTQKVIGHAKVEAEISVDYVSSPDADAFKDEENCVYEYLGKIGQGMTRIVNGSYVGTGGMGSSNQCSITFDFVPKLVLITDSSTASYRVHVITAIFGSPIASNTQDPSSSDYAHYTYVNLIWDGTTLKWYSTASTQLQLNEANRRYYYIAIG